MTYAAQAGSLAATMQPSSPQRERPLPWKQRHRERLISALDPWAGILARKYVNTDREYDDLEQVARVGAIKAVDRYEPARGDLLAYALPTMRGEIRHYLRSTWSVHLPRELQDLCSRLPGVEQEMTQALGRAPSEHEVAAHLGISPERVREARAAMHDVRSLPWDAPTTRGADGAPLALEQSVGRPDLRYDRVLDVAVVAEGLRRLRGPERTVVILAYFEERSQREIGEHLGCSQMQVSRLLATAMERLRAHAADDAPVAEPID